MQEHLNRLVQENFRVFQPGELRWDDSMGLVVFCGRGPGMTSEELRWIADTVMPTLQSLLTVYGPTRLLTH